MQVSEPSSEEVHPKSHGCAFTENKHWVSVYWGTLPLRYLFNFWSSALIKINCMLLCNLPLGYAYLLNKPYLLFGGQCPMRPPSVHLYYYIGKTGWQRTGGPLTGQVTGSWWEEAVRKGQEAKETPVWLQPPFCFIRHSFCQATLPTAGMIFVPSTRKWKKYEAPPLGMSLLLSI